MYKSPIIIGELYISYFTDYNRKTTHYFLCCFDLRISEKLAIFVSI